MKITVNNSTIEDREVWNIPINKRIKDITFECKVEAVQKQWVNGRCPLNVEYMYITGQQTVRGNEVVEFNTALPLLTEDTQIATEQIADNVKIFYNNTTYNMPMILNTANNRVRTIDTEANGKVVLKIGDTNSKWYNMAFKLNGVWSDATKIALERGYDGADVKIKSLEVYNIILNGNIAGLNISQIQGIVVQNAGENVRRSIIGNRGTFTYTNELIPSTPLISGTRIYVRMGRTSQQL